jgi:hypothetical protein
VPCLLCGIRAFGGGGPSTCSLLLTSSCSMDASPAPTSDTLPAVARRLWGPGPAGACCRRSALASSSSSSSSAAACPELPAGWSLAPPSYWPPAPTETGPNQWPPTPSPSSIKLPNSSSEADTSLSSTSAGWTGFCASRERLLPAMPWLVLAVWRLPSGGAARAHHGAHSMHTARSRGAHVSTLSGPGKWRPANPLQPLVGVRNDDAVARVAAHVYKLTEPRWCVSHQHHHKDAACLHLHTLSAQREELPPSVSPWSRIGSSSAAWDE